MVLQEPPQRGDELAPSRFGASEAPRGRDEDAKVCPTLFDAGPVGQGEVTHVFGDDRASLRRSGPEYVGIDELAKSLALCQRDDVMALITKTLGHDTVVLLIEQQSQPRAARCCRRQAASSRSASSTFRRIHSSISALWSA